MSRSLRSVLLGTTLLISGPVLAENAVTLDTITIIDTRTESTALSALAGVSTIDQTTLQGAQLPGIADGLRRVPGVGATMSGDDASTAVNIRGMQQMGRVVVTLDGARQDFWRVGHGSGSFYIDPDLIKQVTVIRGPASNSYGSGGIGGVVAFDTLDADDLLHERETWAFRQKLRYGTNGEGWATTSTGAARIGADFDVIGALSYHDTNPYKDGNGDVVRWTGDRITSGFAKLRWRPAEGHEIKLSASRQHIDDIISGSSGSTSPTLSRYDTTTNADTYALSYDYRPGNDLVDLSVKLYRAATDNDQDQVWPEAKRGSSRYYDVSTNGASVQNTSRFSAGGWQNRITFGADWAVIKGHSDADHFGAGRQELWGGFAQWQGNRGIWEAVASLRHDSYSLDGRSKAAPGAPERDVTRDGHRLSPRLSLGASVIEGVQLFGTWSEGYRAPHLQEVFRRNGAHGEGYEPNLLLKPEVAKSWEIGANIRRDGLFRADDSLRGKVTYFWSDVDDYIDTVKTGTVTRYENIGKARLKGLEVEGGYDFGRGYVTLATSAISAKLVSGHEAGATLSNTPLDRTSARLGLRALDGTLDYGLEYQHFADVERDTTRYPKVDLVNLFASWSPDADTRVDLGVENLFDKDYTDPQSGWSTSSDIEQGRGRTLRISFTKRLGG
ncbi:TonB-dependent receptor domain-containing protein [Paenirhodobacter sp.]|uniref:TonB-dependent receptor domain-containing protein n=1 Tax=Paenirhodobacter sp. TaxID=1965326 RepID=UPI003B3CFC8B